MYNEEHIVIFRSGEAENVGDFVEAGFDDETAVIGNDLISWRFASAVPFGWVCEEVWTSCRLWGRGLTGWPRVVLDEWE